MIPFTEVLVLDALLTIFLVTMTFNGVVVGLGKLVNRLHRARSTRGG
jgi:hypothetical protein